MVVITYTVSHNYRHTGDGYVIIIDTLMVAIRH